jgi:hypothetical protein
LTQRPASRPKLGALEVVEDDPAVRSRQRLVGVVEELHVGVVGLLDQRQHRVVVEREDDHPADPLRDPRVDLVDLVVELVVRVALEQLVAALLGAGLGALEQQRIDACRRVRLRERDRLVVGATPYGRERRRRPAERERPECPRRAGDEAPPADPPRDLLVERALVLLGHRTLPRC